MDIALHIKTKSPLSAVYCLRAVTDIGIKDCKDVVSDAEADFSEYNFKYNTKLDTRRFFNVMYLKRWKSIIHSGALVSVEYSNFTDEEIIEIGKEYLKLGLMLKRDGKLKLI